VRARQALILVAALLLPLALVPAPAGAAEVGASQTPAERAREIATALTKDPLYVDPSYAPGLPETMRASVREKAKALGYPVYSIILPLSPSDGFQGKERNVLTLVMDAMRKPGLYVVVEGGGRFPWYETLDVPQLDARASSGRHRVRRWADRGADAVLRAPRRTGSSAGDAAHDRFEVRFC
jgi:hypothetical protein